MRYNANTIQRDQYQFVVQTIQIVYNVTSLIRLGENYAVQSSIRVYSEFCLNNA